MSGPEEEEEGGGWLSTLKNLAAPAFEVGHAGYDIAKHGNEALTTGSPVLGGLGLLYGGYEMLEGIDEYGTAKTVDQGNKGLGTVMKGYGTFASGLGAASGSPEVAGGGAAFTAGVTAGEYLDKGSKALNPFGNDDSGKPQGITDWAANNGVAADQWVAKNTGSEGLGTAAGVAATIGSVMPAIWGPAALKHMILD